jgi:hypothetical protein
MPILRRQIRREIRQTTPSALSDSARRGSIDDSRLITFVDLAGNVVGVITQPDVDVRSSAPRPRAPLGVITLPRVEP